jgi:hypothetical protein
MSDEPATEASDFTATPRVLHAFDFGLIASAAVAVVYGVASDPIGLTWGLAAVGFIGGMVIGAATSKGAWGGRAHPPSRRIQLMASILGIGAWFLAIGVAYLLSQAFYQQAGTDFFSRVSADGLAGYFAGLYQVAGISHSAGVAALAFMAWRWAR